MYDISVCSHGVVLSLYSVFFFQAEDGIRDLVRSRGLGDVYKRQIGEAIGSVSGQSSNKKLNEVFGQIDHDVHEGKNLHDALSYYPKIFPQIAISIIKIGEEAGTLEKNLLFLTDYLKKKYELNKKIKGALFYPLVIMGMAFLEIAGVIFFILHKWRHCF